MKVEQPTPKFQFQPITLTVTIESEAELLGLYHRLNLAPDEVKNFMETCTAKEDEGLSNFTLYSIIARWCSYYRLLP